MICAEKLGTSGSAVPTALHDTHPCKTDNAPSCPGCPLFSYCQLWLPSPTWRCLLLSFTTWLTPRTPFQTAPLDLDTDAFYHARREQVRRNRGAWDLQVQLCGMCREAARGAPQRDCRPCSQPPAR